MKDNPLTRFLAMHGVKYEIHREGKLVCTVEGLPNHEQSTNKAYIGFMPGTDVREQDMIIGPAGEKLFVQEVLPQYVHHDLMQLKAVFLTEREMNARGTSAQTVFNIGSATGSVIGTQASVNFHYNYNADMLDIGKEIGEIRKQIDAASSPDKEELGKIIDLLEEIVRDKKPVEKGILSRFSDVMQRHEWITSPVMSVLLSWLMLR